MIRAAALLVVLATAAVAPPARAEIDVVPVTSPGGIEAWLYEAHSIPILTIAAGFLGGPTLDAEGHEGTTFLMTALLDEGAGDLDSTAFATAREELASAIAFSPGFEEVTVSATMLSENRDATVELMRLAMTEPRFDPEPVERLRAQALAGIRMSRNDPATLASEAFYAEAYPGHPYGRPIGGTLESVAALRVEDLRAAWTGALARDRLRVAVVGDITPEALGPLLDRLFGGLPAVGAALPPTITPTLSGRTTVIDLDVPQSQVVFGNEGLLREDPDFIPAMVMDYILGGGAFSARLTNEMREKRGLTYGVYTYLASSRLAGLYMGGFSSSNDRVAEALDVLRSEWARMAEGGVTEAELVSAKRFLTGDYSLRFQGNGNIAAQLLTLQVLGLDLDYVNARNALVEAVTAEDVARVARRLLQVDALTTVVVGRPEGISASP
jgi:zinc protease